MAFFITLILFAITLLLSEVLKPGTQDNGRRPAGLGDFNFPTATEGRPVPLIWGTVRLDGPNVIWYGDLRQIAITESVKTGLFSSENVVVGFRYRLGIQMAMCRMEIDEFLRIWVDDEVLWEDGLSAEGSITINAPQFFGGEENGYGGIAGTVTIKFGSEEQLAASYLEDFQSVDGVTPAYRGTAYVLLENVLLGTSTTVKPWQFEVRRIPNGLGLASPSVNDGNDANPMNVVFELLTNDEWGLGLPSADIDTAKFAAAAEVLRLEGNGFSFVLDTPMQATDLLDEVQRQIDGVVFLNRTTGKWDIKLARDDYSIGSVPQVTPSNLVEAENFTRGAWAETQNIYLIRFFHRGREYQETYAAAQDMANIRIQGGQIVKSEVTYPGVKDPDLANQIAWRELRSSSFPLAKAKLIVDRSFYNLNPGDVVAWTDPDLNFTQLPMRVIRIDLGQLDQGRIGLDVVQDVFVAVTPSFSSPGTGSWLPLVDTLVDIPLADRQAFEAPRAFTDRDPLYPGLLDRAWVGLRSQGDGAVTVDLVETTDQLVVGTVASFLLAGSLPSTLAPDHATNGTLTIQASPDAKTTILNALAEAPLTDVGEGLANLILINQEFMAYTGFSDPGGNNITLTGLIRGMLDSAPPVSGHGSSSKVWFLHLGGSLTDTNFTASSVGIRPLPKSGSDELDYASATTSTISFDDRGRRPYPPVNPRTTGSFSAYTSGPFSLDSNSAVSGTGANGKGLLFNFTRRDFRQSDEYLKILNEDTLPADFPAANTTEYRLEVRNDPAGANTLLFTTDWGSVYNPNVSRNQVLAATNGVVPSTLRITVETQHVYEGATLSALQDLAVDMAVASSELAGLNNLGALSASETSPVFVAPTTGTYTATIEDSIGSGDVEVRINGGSWTTLIASGNISNTFAVTTSDDLEFRHTGSETPDEYRFLLISPAGVGTDAYAILIL